jgi:hypothetical protein
VLLATYYYNDQIKNDKVGRACSTHGREWKLIQRFPRLIEGDRLVGRPRERWKYNIEMSSRNMGRIWTGFI